ncbi:MAG TPA: GDSL-type esterase/lipase family protein [Bryobacteraceae bacterium]|nr:GDSL-type esterase/lipase family protein [Bryobacteraceae bacterium]
MKLVAVLTAALVAAPAYYPQTPPAAASSQSTAPATALLSNNDALALLRRISQLMESTMVATPGMTRAAAPLAENVKQALANIESTSAQNTGQIYNLLANVRAYLSLSDALPKQYPFAETARKQVADLRDSVDRMDADFAALLEYREEQSRGADRDNLKRYADENARLGPPSANSPRVVFLGDSITDGWRLSEYFSGRDFVNRGISGQITGEMLGRMMADVIKLKPAAMLVLAGTNDIARVVPVSTIENNLTMIADLADFNQIRPVFASVLPVSDYHKNVNPRFEMTRHRPPATILTLNRWLQQFCAQRGYIYADYFASMVDSAGYLQADLADDGLHPNAKGYRAMAPIALNAIDRAVSTQAKKKKKGRLF